MILVTGGLGYIGSHTVLELLASGKDLLILDNLCNSSLEVLNRIQAISGKRPAFVKADIRDKNVLFQVFRANPITDVIHFAGLKAVGESVSNSLSYYENNVVGSVNLLQVMADSGVKNLVFSSSATVYGDPHAVPINEKFPLAATNPYGRSKLMIEEVLRDLGGGDPSWRIAILRYFNPVGAHESGLLGESPNGVPNNLMPFVAQVAIGKRAELSVFGGDYPTPDGTGVRDYIHVVDLAQGHLAALDVLEQSFGVLTVNLGTGLGYSVLEMVRAFEKASGRAVPFKVVDRRPGDIAVCYADPSFAETLLNWKATRGLDAMCADVWRWQSRNPDGI